MSKFNKIELKPIENHFENIDREFDDEFNEESKDYFDSHRKLSGQNTDKTFIKNLHNISAIYPRSPNLNTSRNESFNDLVEIKYN